MLRTFVVLLTIGALAASGVALYTHIRKDGVKGVLRTLDVRESGIHPASTDLLAAAHELDSVYATDQNYMRADVSRFGVQLVVASANGFCIQVQKADKWYHLVGPGGTPTEGVC